MFTNDVDRARRWPASSARARWATTPSAPTSAWRSAVSSSPASGGEGGTEGLLPFLETKTVILEWPHRPVTKRAERLASTGDRGVTQGANGMTLEQQPLEQQPLEQQPLATAGSSALGVPAEGLGCMGMSQSYGPGDDTESIVRSAAPSTRDHVPRHRRRLRPETSEILVGAIEGRRGPVPRHQVRNPLDPESTSTRQRPARVRAVGVRRIACAPRRRSHRPLLPAPGRPLVPIEETVGRPKRTRRSGQGRAYRIVRSGAADHRKAHASTPSRQSRTSGRYSADRSRTRHSRSARELGIGIVTY